MSVRAHGRGVGSAVSAIRRRAWERSGAGNIIRWDAWPGTRGEGQPRNHDLLLQSFLFPLAVP